MREIGTVKFDSNQFTDANMLLKFDLIDPVRLNRNLTYLWGKDSDKFPLLTLTEGQGAIASKVKVNGGDTQYTWDIALPTRVTSRVKVAITGKSIPAWGSIEVVMEDNWFIYQHTAISPSGLQFRIQSEGVPVSGGYNYRFTLMSGTPVDATVVAKEFAAGAVWALGASSIPASKSDGNRSNKQSFSKATNQYGYYRFSKQIAGNMGNKVVDIAFDTESGGSRNLWMPYEMKQWEIMRREMLEEDLWFSEYNRDANGVIHLIDEKTGEVVPRGAGVRDILKAVGNHETYSVLTLNRFDRIITRLFDNRVDASVDELILYCGKGFARMFNDAIYRDARLKGYFTALGEKEVQDSDGMLSYGKYFNRYKMFNGKVLTVKCVDMFDHGIRAKRDRQAGRMYNGLPLTSYTAVFLDHSMGDNGERNIQFVCEEGREYKVGVYKGMADLPASWGLANTTQLSDTRDIASYEVLGSQGINIANPTTCFWLELDLD